jgi:hypothetical protein
MMLTAAKRTLSPTGAIRSWQGACVFARPATSPEGSQDSLNTLEHGNGPGG